jgi:hypothetical protein
LFLYKSDLEYLERRFGLGAPSTHRLGVGTACREIIHERVKKLRAKESERENERLSSIVIVDMENLHYEDDNEIEDDDDDDFEDEEELVE